MRLSVTCVPREARLLAELGNPEFVVGHVIVSPPERKEEPLPKAYVEDNVRRFESVTPTPTIPDPPPPPPRVRNNAGVPREVYESEIRRYQAFLDSEFNSDSLPIVRPRKGW